MHIYELFSIASSYPYTHSLERMCRADVAIRHLPPAPRSMISARLHHLLHLELHEITGFRPRLLVLEPILVLGCLDLGTQKLGSGSDVPGISYGVWGNAEICVIQMKTENTSPTNIVPRVWLSTIRSFMYLRALSMICVPAFTRTVLLVPGSLCETTVT